MAPSTLPPPAPQQRPAGQTVDGEFVQYADFIERQIGHTRGQVKWVELFSESLLLVLGGCVYLFAAVLVDHWLVEGGLGFRSRLLAFMGLMGIGGFFLWRRIVPLLTLQINPLYAASAIEKHQPALKNSLINFLLLRRSTGVMPKVVYDAIEERAATDLSHVAVDAAVDRSRLIKAGYAAIALVAIAGIYKLTSPKDPIQSIGRVVFPWADLGAPTRVTIDEVLPGNAMAFTGDTVTVKATITGLGAGDKAFLYYTTEDGSVVDEALELTLRDYRYEGVLPPEGPGGKGLGQSLRYHVVAGDSRSNEFRLEVQPPPAISVESIEYEYPFYTGLSPRTEKGLGDIKAIEGTRVIVRAGANQVIRPGSALLDYDADGKEPNLALKPVDKDPRRVWGAFLLNLTKDGTQEHSQYLLRFKNEAGLLNPNPIRYRIDVIADLAPTVEFAAPARDTELPVNDKLELDIRAADQDFALSQVYLRLQKQEKDLLGSVDEPGERLIQLKPLEKQPPKLAAKYVLEPAKLGLSVGDEVVYWASAHDNKGATQTSRRGLPNIVDTQKWRVKIIAPAQAKPPMPNELAKNEPRQGEQKQEGNGNGKQERNPNGQGKVGDIPDQDPRNQPEKPPAEPLGDKTSPTPQVKPGDKSLPSKSGSEESKQQEQEQANPERDPGKVFDDINRLRKEQQEEQEQNDKKNEPKPDEENAGGEQKQDPGQQNSGAGNSGKKSDDKEGSEKQQGDKSKQGKSGDKSGEKQSGEKQQGDKETGEEGSEEGSESKTKGKQPSQKKEAGNQSGEKQPGEKQPGEKQSPNENGSEKTPGQKQDGNKQGTEKQPGEKQGNEKQPGEKGGEKKQPGEKQGGEKKPGEKQGSEKQPGEKQGNEKSEGEKSGEKGEKQGKEKQPGDKQGEEKQPGEKQGGEKQPGEKQGNEKQGNEKEPGEKKQGSGGEKSPNPQEQSGGPQGPSEEKQGNPKQGAGESKSGDPKSKQNEGQPKTDESQEGGQREKAEGGAEGKKQENGGPTPASQGKENQKDKTGKPEQDQNQQGNNNNDAKSPSTSDHNSTTQGSEAGDKSGQGKPGGGQQAPQKGQGTAGKSTESQTGAAAGKESGDGDRIDRAGNKGTSQGKTGNSSTDKPGEGSKTRKTDGPGDSQSPKEVAGKAEKTDQKSAKTQHKGEHPDDVKSQGSKPGEGPAKGQTDQGEGADGQGNPTRGGGQTQAPGEAPRNPEPFQDDPVKLDETVEGVDLALKHLKDELAKPRPDPRLIKMFGSREEAQKYYEHWKQTRDQALQPGADNAEKRRQAEEALRGLGIQQGGAKVDTVSTARDAEGRNRERTVVPPPPGYRERTSGFKTGISKPVAEPK